MIWQPDKGTRVRIFKEKTRSLGEVKEPSLIKNYFFNARVDTIRFQTMDGHTESGKCMFLGSSLLAIETESGKTIPHFKLSKKQVTAIEKAKGGFRYEEK